MVESFTSTVMSIGTRIESNPIDWGMSPKPHTVPLDLKRCNPLNPNIEEIYIWVRLSMSSWRGTLQPQVVKSPGRGSKPFIDPILEVNCLVGHQVVTVAHRSNKTSSNAWHQLEVEMTPAVLKKVTWVEKMLVPSLSAYGIHKYWWLLLVLLMIWLVNDYCHRYQPSPSVYDYCWYS